jgi:hypothetical protein
MWRTLLALPLLATLAACGSTPEVETQFNGLSLDTGPTSPTDPRMRSPHFYMDEPGGTPAWMLVTPQPNR